MPRSTAKPEAIVQAAILLRWGAHPQVRLWRQNSGLLWAPASGGKLQRVRAGVVGCADLSGLIGPNGRRLEIEAKAEGQEQSADQIAFMEMVGAQGGLYILAFTVSDVDQVLVPLVGEPTKRSLANA